MAHIISLKTHKDHRGDLTVLEKVLPFEIRRIYYIYNANEAIRGNHRHLKTIQAAISVSGKCKINVKSGDYQKEDLFKLDSPEKCLILNPEDYHYMYDFSKDCVLLVIASEYFDADDYIDENYR